MLKYKNIISSLSDERKARLLTDLTCLEDKIFLSLGVPKVRMAALGDHFGDGLPHPKALANSWDVDAVKAIARERLEAMAKEGYNLIELPSAKPAVNPYTAGMSEDPVLSAKLLMAYLDAAAEVGVMPLVSGLDVTESDIEWLDKEPNYRTVYENLVLPHMEAKKSQKEIAFLSENIENKAYKGINVALSEHANESGEEEKKSFSLLKNVPDDETVDKISKGYICVNASFETLMAAMNRHKELKRALNSGKTTVSELENEIAAQTAISPESVDAAVDRLLEFAEACSRVGSGGESTERGDLEKNAFADSSVLVKNEDNILPIRKSKKQKRICIVGGIDGGRNLIGSFSELKKFNRECVYIEGYDPSKCRDDLDFSSKEEVVKSSETVILLLEVGGVHEELILAGRKLTLPANQMALCHKLNKYGEKVIAVVSSNYAIDPTFAEAFSALLLTPFGVANGLSILTEILMGEREAGGRLATTMYGNSDEELKKCIAYKKMVGMKVGPFTGYRRYDTEGSFDGYSFGHGLSYTGFKYSRPKIKNGFVEVTVKNIGNRVGTEIVQMYVGRVNSSVLSPKKELVAFEKLVLKPREKKKVRFELVIPQVYDVSSRSYITPGGEYTVYIASSVNSSKRQKTTKIKGETVETDYTRLSDYLQSESNVISDKYTLEANYKRMKRLSKNSIYGVLLLIIALALRYYSRITVLDDNFINIISIILAVSAIVLFVIEMSERKKHHATAVEELDKANKEHFSDAQTTQALNADNMFVNEFDNSVEEETHEETVVHDSAEAEALKYIDKNLTFGVACKEFESFAANRGCVISSNTAKRILSSLCASRLMVVKGMEEGDFVKLVSVIGEYFGTLAYVETANKELKSENQLLFDKIGADGAAKRKILLAMEAARNERENIFLVGINNVESSNISSYFVPFARYAKNPLTGGSFTSLNEHGVNTTYKISPNMWFVLNLKAGVNVASLPRYVTEVATVVDIKFEKTSRKSEPCVVKQFRYYQMDYLTEEAKKQFSLSEDDWKKIDGLEEYANNIKPYSVGNRQCTAIETYVAAYVACGGDAKDVLDIATAVKLLPSVFSELKGAIPADAAGLAETVSAIFGEENCSMCEKAIADCAPDIK